jgi:sigma-B regulation protein RsbU (phosphoserine phosphatase)
MNVEELQRSVTLYKGLVEVSALINSITDFNELLSAILDVARRVVKAEASSLFLINENSGNLELTIARGPAGETLKSPVVIPRGRGIAGWVREKKQSLLVADAYHDSRFFADLDRTSGFVTRSVLAVPLFQGETEIGVLEVLNPLEKSTFDRLDLEAFEAYGNLVATAMSKLRAIQQQREQLQLEKDLALATEIQHSFLPDHLPSTHLLSLAASYRPARDIAGDFYDVFERNPGEFYFVVGDVSGKGIPAALMMAQAISMLRLIVHPGLSPADALARWNARLCGRTIRGMFITAVLGRIRPEQGSIEFSVAGHMAPFIRYPGLTVDQPAIQAAPPLGIVREQVYSVNRINLLPGYQAIFYTDGLVESFNTSREPFSVERVRQVLSQPSNGLETLISELLAQEQQHRGDQPPHDDLTILAIGLK